MLGHYHKSNRTFFVKILLEEVKHGISYNECNDISFSGKNVLIIDELPVSYSLLGIYLHSLNINLLSASSGKDALKIYRTFYICYIPIKIHILEAKIAHFWAFFNDFSLFFKCFLVIFIDKTKYL